MLHTTIGVFASVRRLAERCEGSVAVMFGLCAIPAIIAAGMAIDVGRAYMVKVRLGAAMDAAALAIGSQTNQTQTQLTTALQNYFTANYPSTALGTNVTITPVPANADLTAATVTFQAQATVPMAFMQLVGFNNITVSVTAQTKKTVGLEVALVLDNTGSMLCGANEGAASTCGADVVASDTTCTDSSNNSRICTLINAAKDFVNTLSSAITASQQLYISIVPYVTTVNVGNAFCTGAFSCSHITTDSCSGDFTDDKGNIISVPAAPLKTVTGTTSSGSLTISGISPNTTGISIGMAIKGGGIKTDTIVASIVSSTKILISKTATSSNSGTQLTFWPSGATVSGSKIITAIQPNTSTLSAGMVISGTGVTPNKIVSVDNANQITVSCNATATTVVGAGVLLTPSTAVSYDTTNTSTTQNWMGCVIEPTSSDENSGVSGVINASVSDPDYTEPGSWPNWYPFWWPSGGVNTWPPVKDQSTATEIQGQEYNDWLAFPGPNQGCPVPLLPLTDVTASAGKTQVLNRIGSMWPRDAGGTQVHIGMIWGWRVLSPNGPFAPTNGHPLSYANATTTGWKKVVVLMTDGQEEWPATDNMTGLGQIADGKIGTTSSTTTAVNNLNTRLNNVCNNMETSGFIIYTIGLGSNGANNRQLQNCATTSNGGFFEAATPSNLQKVFNDVAKSLIALRLSQ